MKNILGFLFMIISLLFFYDYIENTQLDLLAFGENGNDKQTLEEIGLPYGMLIVSIIAMLAGIFFGSINDSLKAKKDNEEIHFVSEIVLVTKKKRFLNAMLASPVIFIGVYMAAKTQPDLVLATLLAFQNGFFCDAIMKKGK